MMHKYSFPVTGNMAVAQAYDVNASYKDLCAVCDAIRYAKADDAFAVLDSIISKKMPIHVRRFNKHMGAKHELGGAKGAFPVMAAKQVRKVLVNALANADSKGIDTSNAIIAYATANKTHIERRSPPKGTLSWGRGMYGYSARVHSDIEYAKIELALAEPEEVGRKPRKVRLPYVGQAHNRLGYKPRKGNRQGRRDHKHTHKGNSRQVQNRQSADKRGRGYQSYARAQARGKVLGQRS